jgi:hypothetical protein
MLRDVENRRLALTMQPPDKPGDGRRPRFRESLDTLLLGVLSTSIGLVLLIALCAGIVRRPIPGWNERAISSSAYYFVPSKDCAIAAFVGIGLGLTGIMLARHRHRTISLLSTLGTAISWLHIALFFLFVSLMELL